MGFLTF